MNMEKIIGENEQNWDGTRNSFLPCCLLVERELESPATKNAAFTTLLIETEKGGADGNKVGKKCVSHKWGLCLLRYFVETE